ncbi:MAG: T9SS type A sorting domain-containing protein, partial [Bacteroidota bacterium]|nr:T9SS type A sorting domain-containing protein [Bacteroidota bacterium]
RFYGVAKSNDSTTCFILDNNFNPIGFSLPVANKDLVLNNPPVQGHTVTFFQFPQPIQVTDTFYIGVMFNDYRNVSPLKDTISIYTTAQNERKNNFIYQNVYYTYINDTINLLDIKKSIGLNLNLMIAPVLDFCTLTVTSSADVTISKGQSTTLTQTNSGGTGNVNILWSTNPTFSDTTKITNALSVIVNPTTTTKYYVLAVTKDGCVAEDSVLVTVNNANGISSINAVDNLTIYPSPANDVLNIRFNSQEMQNVNVKIYNVIGKLVYNVNTSATNGEFNKTIDVKSLTKGLYLVQIESAKGTISRKVEIR